MMPEGYGFNYFKNDSIEGSLREVVSYTRFTGIELVRPYKNSNYEVLVPPKQSKIVLLRQTNPISYNLRFKYSSTILLTTEALKARAKEKGKMTTRKDPLTGQPVNIFVYSLKHGGGICYLYLNETTNRTLEECMKFQLKGLNIEEYKNQNEIHI